MSEVEHVTIHWFRHGLRLHDNPALFHALETSRTLYHVFIFDGEVAGTKHCGYNRWRFLHESLVDIDRTLKKHGTRLYVFQGNSAHVFKELFQEWGVTQMTFEQDPEPIWRPRDQKVMAMCQQMSIKCVEKISHTLYDPDEIIQANGNMPPLTYRTFVNIMDLVGEPNEPEGDPVYKDVNCPVTDNYEESYALPSLNDLGINYDCEEQKRRINEWQGGETRGLELLEDRIRIETEAFEKGIAMPNQSHPDLVGAPASLSPYLRFGAISARLFYYRIREAFQKVMPGVSPPDSILTQLIWREYFYVMSVNNPQYGEMNDNPICLQIDWYEEEQKIDKWEQGRTGYPWIDACMKQLRSEGWLHHTGRNAVACFLTRGDLWQHWERGLQVFLKYLLDADWSVCAGNWMWVSSSAFEDCLQCPMCFSPVTYGMKMDPTGEYVRRYVPVLKDMPLKYLYCPWKAPLEVQEKAGCVVGKDYPEPMVDHSKAWKWCKQKMTNIKDKFKDPSILHITPSDVRELRKFFFLSQDNASRCTADELCQAIEAANI